MKVKLHGCITHFSSASWRQKQTLPGLLLMMMNVYMQIATSLFTVNKPSDSPHSHTYSVADCAKRHAISAGADQTPPEAMKEPPAHTPVVPVRPQTTLTTKLVSSSAAHVWQQQQQQRLRQHLAALCTNYPIVINEQHCWHVIAADLHSTQGRCCAKQNCRRMPRSTLLPLTVWELHTGNLTVSHKFPNTTHQKQAGSPCLKFKMTGLVWAGSPLQLPPQLACHCGCLRCCLRTAALQ